MQVGKNFTKISKLKKKERKKMKHPNTANANRKTIMTEIRMAKIEKI